MKLLRLIIISVSIFFFTAALHAEITVLKVTGSAAYRDGNKWMPLKVGQKLPEGVKVSTGANSSAELKLNSQNHSVNIKPFTMIQVYSKESKTDTNTHIGLKRGAIYAKVPRKGNIKTIFKVSSPIATSSVRGTDHVTSHGHSFGTGINPRANTTEGKNRHGRKNYVSGKQKYLQGPNQGTPHHILQGSRNKSFARVFGHGLTPEELASMLYSDDQTGSAGGDTGNFGRQGLAKVSISINY